MRFSPGTSGMPFGTAQETATPSRSRRRSQCRRVAECSCTTKRSPPAESVESAAGSGVDANRRLRRYSPSSLVFLDLFVGLTIRSAVRFVLALLREAVQRGRVLRVLRVLDQKVLRLLEPVLLAAAGFVDSLPGRVVVTILVGFHGGDPTHCGRAAHGPARSRTRR